MFYVIVLKSEINGETVYTVRGNIPSIDPALPDIPVEERFPSELLKDTIESETEVPNNWRYDPESGEFSEPPEPEFEPEFETADAWREDQYRTRPIIELGNSILTVDEAVLKQSSYYAEWLAEHDATDPIPQYEIVKILSVKIHEAKGIIREESKGLFPDEAFSTMSMSVAAGLAAQAAITETQEKITEPQ